jgi:hypothetical protein
VASRALAGAIVVFVGFLALLLAGYVDRPGALSVAVTLLLVSLAFVIRSVMRALNGVTSPWQALWVAARTYLFIALFVATYWLLDRTA